MRSRAHSLTLARIQQAPTIYLKFEGGSYAHLSFSPGENDWWNVTLQTDWGNWSYGWRQRNIFSFLLECSKDYIYRNFTKDETVFCEKTAFKSVKRAIKDACLEVTSEMKEQLGELEGRCGEDERDFFDALYRHCPLITEQLPDICMYVGGRVPHPRNVYFFKHIYPKFKPYLRKLAKQQEKLNEQNLLGQNKKCPGTDLK